MNQKIHETWETHKKLTNSVNDLQNTYKPSNKKYAMANQIAILNKEVRDNISVCFKILQDEREKLFRVISYIEEKFEEMDESFQNKSTNNNDNHYIC